MVQPVLFLGHGSPMNAIEDNPWSRAWRALGQWRSSWLSREGIAAIACAFVALATAVFAFGNGAAALQRIAGLALAANSVVVVFCTARIYTSLPTIAARFPELFAGE